MKTINKALIRMVAAGLLLGLLTGLPPAPVHAADSKLATPPKPHQLTAAVVRCEDKSLVVSNIKGKETTFAITPETKFGTTNAAKNPEDFRPGNHVRVTYIRGEGGKLVAQQVVAILSHPIK